MFRRARCPNPADDCIMKKISLMRPLLWVVWLGLLVFFISAGWFWARLDSSPQEAPAPASAHEPPSATAPAAVSLAALPPVVATAPKADLMPVPEKMKEAPVVRPDVGAVKPVPSIQPHEVMPSPEQLAAMPVPPEVIAAQKFGPPPDILRGMNNPPQEYLNGLKTPPPWVGQSPFKK